MNWERLRDFTPARVAIGRTGHSLPTRELLAFQSAHAGARDAVQATLQTFQVVREIQALGLDPLVVRSAAQDRRQYLLYPDRGRRLSDESAAKVSLAHGEFDVAFVIADGLSALAVERHAAPMLAAVLPVLRDADWRIAPVAIAEQGRVAIGDEIGERLGAALSIVLIGERPGLSSPDGLGAYLTWQPRRGRTDAERNCISNIRSEGLSYAAAAQKLWFLMTESRRRKLSGVQLKEGAAALPEGRL